MPPKKKGKTPAPRTKKRKTKLAIPEDKEGTSASGDIATQDLSHWTEEDRVRANYDMFMGAGNVVGAKKTQEYVVPESFVEWSRGTNYRTAHWSVSAGHGGLCRVTVPGATVPATLIQMFKEFVENARDQFFREFGKCNRIQVGVCMHEEYGAGLCVQNNGNGIPMAFVDFKGKMERQADVALRLGVSSNYDAEQGRGCAGAHGLGGSVPPLAGMLTRVTTIRVEEDDDVIAARKAARVEMAQQVAEFQKAGASADVLKKLARLQKSAQGTVKVTVKELEAMDAEEIKKEVKKVKRKVPKGEEELFAKVLSYEMNHGARKVVNRSFEVMEKEKVEEPYTRIEWWPDWKSSAFNFDDAPVEFQERPDQMLLHPDAILPLLHFFTQTMSAITDSMRATGASDAWREKMPASLSSTCAMFTHPGIVISEEDEDEDVVMVEEAEVEEQQWRVPWNPTTFESWVRCWSHAENPAMPLYCVAEKDVKSDKWARMRIFVGKKPLDDWPRGKPHMDGVINGVNVPGGKLTEWVAEKVTETVGATLGEKDKDGLSDHLTMFGNWMVDKKKFAEQIKNTYTVPVTQIGFRPQFTGRDKARLLDKKDPLLVVVKQVHAVQKAAKVQATRVKGGAKTSRKGNLLPQEEYDKKVGNTAEARGVALAMEHSWLQPTMWTAEGLSALGNCTTAVGGTQPGEAAVKMLQLLLRLGPDAAVAVQEAGAEKDKKYQYSKERYKMARRLLKKTSGPQFEKKGRKGAKKHAVNEAMAIIIALDNTISLEKDTRPEMVFGGFFCHTIMALKGVPRNWATSSKTDRKKNVEFQMIMQHSGINPDHMYPEDDKKLLHTYQGGMFDQDHDGFHIWELWSANLTGMNLTLLYSRPDMFRVFVTPVLRVPLKGAGKSKEAIAALEASGVHVIKVGTTYTCLFYSLPEYEQWKKYTDFPEEWFGKPLYTKGLGTLPVKMAKALFAQGRNVFTVRFDVTWTAVTKNAQSKVWERPDAELMRDSVSFVAKKHAESKAEPEVIDLAGETEVGSHRAAQSESGPGDGSGAAVDDEDVVMEEDVSAAKAILAMQEGQSKTMTKLAKSSAMAMSILEAGIQGKEGMSEMDKSVRLLQQMTQDTKDGTKEFRRHLLRIHSADEYIDIARCRDKGYVIPMRDMIYCWVLSWGKATIARCLPCVYSGLKKVEMKLLTLAIKGHWKPAKDGSDGMLTMNVRAAMPTHTDYDHNPNSVPAERLTQAFSGSLLVLSWIVGKGNLGSREWSQNWAADRYTHMSPNMALINVIFGKKDWNIVPWTHSQGNYTEPLYLLGSVPISLINGTSAVAFGFTSRVFPRDPMTVHAAASTLQRVMQQQWEASMGKDFQIYNTQRKDGCVRYELLEEVEEREQWAMTRALSSDEFTQACRILYPHFPCNEASLAVVGSQVVATAQYEVLESADHKEDGSWDVLVTELPPERYVGDVKSAAMKTGKDGTRVGTAFSSEQVDYTTRFRVRISGDVYAALTKKTAKLPDGRVVHPDLVAKLKLSTRFNYREQSYIYPDGTVEHTHHPKQVFTIWAKQRVKTSQEGRAYNLACLNADMARDYSRYSWIKGIVEGRIKTHKQPLESILGDIEQWNADCESGELEEWPIVQEHLLVKPTPPYKRMDGALAKNLQEKEEEESDEKHGYEYLLRMPISSLTEKGMKLALSKAEATQEQALRMAETPMHVEWGRDLEEWERVVSSYLAQKYKQYGYAPGRAKFSAKKSRMVFGEL